MSCRQTIPFILRDREFDSIVIQLSLMHHNEVHVAWSLKALSLGLCSIMSKAKDQANHSSNFVCRAALGKLKVKFEVEFTVSLTHRVSIYRHLKLVIMAVLLVA